MVPGNRHARLIETGRHPVKKVRPVHVVLDVFLAGPDDLHRTVHVHGDLDRARDAVDLEPATKAAADQVVVDHDLVQRQSGGLCGGGLCTSDDLAADPDFATVLANIDGAVHGLHRRVGQKRHLVDRVDFGDGPRDCLGDIADVLCDRPWIERSFLEITRDILDAECRVRPVVPLNDQGRETLLCRSHVVGHDGNRIVQPHDLAHAFNCLGGRVVDAFQPAAEDGRLRERRDLQPRQFDIDSVDGRSVDLRRRVKTLGRRADELEFFRALERHLLGNGQLRCIAGKRPVSDPALARLVDYFTTLRMTRGRLHLPALCRRSDQHDPGSCTGLPQRFPHSPYRGRSARALHAAKQGVAIALFIRWRMLQSHLAQGHLQLFRNEHGYGGVGALPHLHIRHGQRHRSVTTDANEGVGHKAARLVRHDVADKSGQTKAKHQSAAGGDTALEENPARQAVLGSGVGR